MRQVFGWLGSCPETKRISISYDMVSHPLLQMSTSHIVVKRKLIFTWALLLFNITAFNMEVYFLCKKQMHSKALLQS